MNLFGYCGKILKVDLSSGEVDELCTADYADKFIGGRGFAAKIHWDWVPPDISAFDPENCLTFTTGPLAGFPRLGGSRWQVCGKSCATDPEVFSYANAGGSWGAWLKFAGVDAIAVTGKSDTPVYLFIKDGQVRIGDASSLKGKSTIEARERLKAELGKNVKVVAIGPAAESLVRFATLLGEEDSSASSGFGAVMGSKNLKAIVVAGDCRPTAARPEELRELSEQIVRLRKGTHEMYTPAVPGHTRRQACWGCPTGCTRQVYTATDGDRGKFFCESLAFYLRQAQEYYGEWPETAFYANRLCDKYGLDTAVMEPMIIWLSRCYQEGVLSEAETGLQLSKMGSRELIENLVRKISLKEGFGEVLAQGILGAARQIGNGAIDLIGDCIATKASEVKTYDPRLYTITALLYATEPRRPIQQLHEVSITISEWIQHQKGGRDAFLSSQMFRSLAKRFWGSEIAADFSSPEGAALAAKRIQDRTYAKESLILCDFLWPIMWVRYSEDHAGHPDLESRLLSAITGLEINEDQLNGIGERVFNLQRAILAKESRAGRENDALMEYFHTDPLEHEVLNRRLVVPGKDGEPISRKGAILERDEFEQMKTEYYHLRGWDSESGLQTRAKLMELGLNDIAAQEEMQGLLR
jgi:aldehyde:ferredoxin oxidoreductase